MTTADQNVKPMPLAEAAECCGQHSWGNIAADRDARVDTYCANCPLLIDRTRTDVLRQARAM